MSLAFTKSTVEDAALEILEGLGYTILHGPEIAPGELLAERTDYSEVVLVGRLEQALGPINPRVPAEAIAEAVRKVLSIQAPNLEESDRQFQRFLTDGIHVECRKDDRIVYDQ